MSGTQEKHETLLINPFIHICIRIDDEIVFRTYDGYKLKLQTTETMKLFGIKENIIRKINNGENIPSLEVAEVALIQCSLIDN